MKSKRLSIFLALFLVMALLFGSIHAENSSPDAIQPIEENPIDISEQQTPENVQAVVENKEFVNPQNLNLYSQLSDAEKEAICNTAQIPNESMMELESFGYTVSQSIELAAFMNKYTLTAADTHKLLLRYNGIELLSQELSAIDTYRENTTIDQQTMAQIMSYICQGQEITDILYDHSISITLGLPLDEVINMKTVDPDSEEYKQQREKESALNQVKNVVYDGGKYSDLTAVEQAQFMELYKLEGKDLLSCEENGYNLKESIEAIGVMKDFSLNISQLKSLYEVKGSFENIQKEFQGVATYIKFQNLTQENIADLVELSLAGYSVDEMLPVSIVANSLNSDIKTLYLPKEQSKAQKNTVAKEAIEEEDNGFIDQLEENYHINKDALLQLASENNLSVQEIQRNLSEYQKGEAEQIETQAAKTQKDGGQDGEAGKAGTMASTTPPEGDIQYNKYLGAPFSYRGSNNESISVNSGALDFFSNLLNLPGRNGNDLNIGIRYNSSNANLSEEDYSITSVTNIYYYELYLRYTAYKYVPGEGTFITTSNDYLEGLYPSYYHAYISGEQYAQTITTPFVMTETFNASWINYVTSKGTYTPWSITSTTQSSPAPENYQINERGYNGTIPRIGTVEHPMQETNHGNNTWTKIRTYEALYSGTLFKVGTTTETITYTLVPVYMASYPNYGNTTKPTTYTELHNNLGAGWEFNFSNIETLSDNSKYLHLSDGNTYKINITDTAGDSNLDKYLLKDMRLETDSGSYSNGQMSSSYVLIYKNGAKEYFAGDGRLLAIRDRYNNTIKFEHDTSINGHPLITKITDTLDRVTIISYQNVTNGKEVTITAPGSRVIKLVQEQIPGYGGDYALKKIIDPENRETSFAYSYDTGVFNFISKSVSGPSIAYANLKEVKYPTKGLSRYNYQKAVGNLGNQGVHEYYRIQTREDIDGSSSYSRDTYSYTNNYTGYGNINDPNNLPDTFTYMTTVTDAKGNTVTYSFNNKHLTTKTETKENGTTLLSKNDYIYYLDRLVAAQTNTLYNKQGGSRVLQQDWSYNDFGDLLKYTDAARYATDYQYDSTFHLIKSITKTANDAGLLMYTYNDINPSNGNVNYTRQQHIENGVNKDITTTYTYDTYGNITNEVITQTGEKTIQTRYDYDTAYKSAYLTKKTTIVKDYKGVSKNVIESYEYNINTGDILKYINANGKATQYQYDKLGRKKLVTNPDATNIAISYDDINNKATVTDENGHQVRASYDTLGRELAKEEMKSSAWKMLSQTKYNILGQVDFTLDSKNNKTSYIYDAAGRAIKTIFADSSYAATDYNDAYTATTSLKTVYDEEQNRRDYIYDNLGNLIKEISYPIKGDSSKQNITQYHYNRVGKADYIIDANNHRTSYAYDDLNRLTAVTNAKEERTEYTYDILGNVKSIKDADGNPTTKVYDELGRMIEQKNPLYQKENWEYDNAGNMTVYIDKTSQKTTNTYNDRNWLTNTMTSTISTTYGYGNTGELKTVTDATGTVTYEYYENGSLKSKKLPDNKIITYEYDDNNNLTKLTDYFNKATAYTYDSRNRMKTVAIDAKTTTYDYYLNGSRKSMDNAGILRTEYTYFGDNQLKTITNKKGSNIVSSYAYTYDPVGNQLTKTDVSNNKTQYAYDLLNRIQKVTEQDNTQTEYNYDKSGNISWKNTLHPASYVFSFKKNNTEQHMAGLTSHTIHYTYNEANQLLLTREQILNNADAQSTYNDLFEKVTVFSYDGNGNLTKKENAGTLDPEVYSYTYNKLNQMTQFTDSNNQATDYTYYADGLRSSKQTGADKIQYYYSGDEVILETLNGNFSTRTIQGINEIARQDSTGGLYYYQYNGHGDVVNLLDGSGNVRNTYDFDEFGNEKVAVENGIYNPLRYTGEYYDSESGLYYLRARYYDPEIGRFISEDTNKGKIEDPLSLNLYSYCNNNPILYVDRTGHAPKLEGNVNEGTGGMVTGKDIQGMIKAMSTKSSTSTASPTNSQAAAYSGGGMSGAVAGSNEKEEQIYKGDLSKGTSSNTQWADKDGNIKWPTNNGSVTGTEKNIVLQKGYLFDRFGKNSGSYVSPLNTPFEMRSLAPGTENAPYRVFQVVKPVKGQGSIIAPWFNQPGGGIQFKLESSIENLLQSKKIIEVIK